MMDKVFFWRHKEEPLDLKEPINLGGLGKESDIALGVEPEPGMTTGPTPPMPGTIPPGSMPEPPTPPQPATSFAQPMAQQPSMDKDIQLLNAKLDSLKAILENIHQRLVNIERLAHESEKQEIY
ncbi:MAG: hypothetical protein V3V78_03110 [Candidatus Woesearchaeota archaeon]